MCDSIDPISVLANVATGGLYGATEGVLKGRPLQAAASPGVFGSVVQPTLGTGPALQGELVGAGAGLGGGGVGALKPTGFGAAGGPLVGPEGIPILTDASGAAAIEIDPVTGSPLPGGAIPASAIAAGYGGAAFTGGAETGQALLGAGAAQVGSNAAESFLGAGGRGTMPLSIPTGGASVGGPTAAQLSAIASQPHEGLAPWFRMRQAGGKIPGGIAEPDMSGHAYELMQRYPALMYG